MRGLFGGRERTNNILSVSASAMSSLAACTPKCVSGSRRVVINLRASTPLGEKMGPFNNVHVTERTYTTCKCGLNSGVRGRFHCEAARGSNIFETCASRVQLTQGDRIVANLPSTCNHNHVVNSCHHITLCNISQLVRRGRGSGTGLNLIRFAARRVHLSRRLFHRVGFLGLVGRVTRVCNYSVDNPTSGAGRTIR